MKRVAIVQNHVQLGGRLDLIVHFIKVLNSIHITPDIVAFSFSDLNEEKIRETYAIDINFRLNRLNSVFSKLPYEFNIMGFNLALNKIKKDYDLFINSNNTAIFMPGKGNIVYLHFPRKFRALSRLESIHTFSPKKKPVFSFKGLYFAVVSLIYRLYRKPKKGTQILCNSEFTRNAFEGVYPNNKEPVYVVYPPYRAGKVISKGRKQKWVVNIGRFAPDKGQLELIGQAARCPEFHFHLIGFAREGNEYLAACRKKLEQEPLPNVTLHPNAGPEEKDALLTNAMAYIHTKPNEPFGLGILQGIVEGNCIPIVPASGGQKEIVPYPELQYRSLEEIGEKLQYISDDAVRESLLLKLKRHAEQYEFSRFSEQIRGLFV